MNKKLTWFIVADLVITGGILLVFYFNSNNSQDQNESDFTLSSEQNSSIENVTEEIETSSGDIVTVILVALTILAITAFFF